MQQMTIEQLRHIESRAFAQILASIEAAADAVLPIGQRDRSRRGTDKGEALIKRRCDRRATAARKGAFLLHRGDVGVL